MADGTASPRAAQTGPESGFRRAPPARPTGGPHVVGAGRRNPARAGTGVAPGDARVRESRPQIPLTHSPTLGARAPGGGEWESGRVADGAASPRAAHTGSESGFRRAPPARAAGPREQPVGRTWPASEEGNPARAGTGVAPGDVRARESRPQLPLAHSPTLGARAPGGGEWGSGGVGDGAASPRAAHTGPESGFRRAPPARPTGGPHVVGAGRRNPARAGTGVASSSARARESRSQLPLPHSPTPGLVPPPARPRSLVRTARVP